ncbi:hypothetical protein GCM10010435_12230 [Winogradskya consettensis]|uniref:Cell wall anchor protein n=1 Tax=Winogradskya consettensis TaxID=113560 RepID=A0A919SBI3_9ACTN|nr:hypothetical protein Aco04nite_11490 [Actinoplanes consettensis]
MKAALLKTLFHRVAAIAAGALVGLTGLVAIAAPASAAGPQITITGSAECNPAAGQWLVTWTVTNSGDSLARVDKLQTSPVPVPELTNGTLIPRRNPSGVDGKQIFKQTVEGGVAAASVSFVGIWADNTKDADNKASVQLGDCKPAETPCVGADDAKFHHTFAVADGKSTATVTLDDDVKLCDAEPVTLVTYFAPKTNFSVPQYAFAHQSGTITNENRSVELTADLPACNAQVDLFFGDEGDIIPEITEGGPRYNDKKLGSAGKPGNRSKGPQGWYNGGSKACQTPAVEPLSSCDGTVTINLSNTGDLSKYPVDFTVKAGDFSRTVTVAPGKGDTVTVPAGAGPITVTADGMDDVKYEWQRPADCPRPTLTVENDCRTVTVTVTNPEGVTPATATVVYNGETKTVKVAPGSSEKVTFPADDATEATVAFDGEEPVTVSVPKQECDENGGGSGGDDNGNNGGDNGNGGSGGGDDDGGGLPVTGAAAGGIAAGALALLVAGGVLFFVARRRKVKFTA